MKFFLLICIFGLLACADLSGRSEKQRIQSEINEALHAKSKEISQCLKTHDIFKKLGSNRLRLDVHLTISQEGRMEKFSLENDKNYPTQFVDCLFNVLDSTQFPKLNEGESIELSQPFIFKP